MSVASTRVERTNEAAKRKRAAKASAVEPRHQGPSEETIARVDACATIILEQVVRLQEIDREEDARVRRERRPVWPAAAPRPPVAETELRAKIRAAHFASHGFFTLLEPNKEVSWQTRANIALSVRNIVMELCGMLRCADVVAARGGRKAVQS